jgi:glutamine synthetase
MAIEVDWFLRAHPDITMIEALLPDCNGVLRGKWVPRAKLAKIYKGELKFPRSMLNLDIWGRDIEKLVLAWGDEDGVCRPVEGSLLPTPWSPGGQHGQVMLSMFMPDGEPYLGDPRQVLKQVLARYRARGWRPVVAAELEFSLVEWDGRDPSHSGTHPANRAPLGGNLYGLDILHRHQPMLEEIHRACELQNLPFDGVVKESAPSQYEINMLHVDNAALAARQILMMKRLIKGVAAKHGLVASFMPKPFENEAGNGLHVHCSVLDRQGRNVFDDGTPTGTAELLHAVAGCLTYMPDSFALLAPSYNAYRRFQTGSHAPTSPAWGYENRTVAVRVPAGSNRARRIEHRVAGADANPYLVFAAVLAAALEGIEQRLTPPDPVSGDGYEQAGEAGLPVYMQDALALFGQSDFIRRALGPELQHNFGLTKAQEIAEFHRHITMMEYQTYLQQL